ncbi:histidinol phosphate phosphatase domain-containing protein [Thermodesulfovibrionales bacterium]|nr:histidinol phosphate phosphatase domain-containing protein [Thermodesulfovibrionales bacterium]MCL0086760.1 histidinol phosphate phosphatase domain-containing protein [Thermodesulfovibrionales bacterium]
MIDLHTHSIFSDGELIPAELVRRAVVKGYEAIAITDHIDQSNIDFIIPRIVKAIAAIRQHVSIEIIPGAEITHVPPVLIPDIVREARQLGARIVVVHGETIVESVAEGTNRAAIEAGADILAHPGLITNEDLKFAKEKGITLEISGRKGHSLSNGHVAKWAIEMGIPLSLNTDAHSPSDLITMGFARQILLSTRVEMERIDSIFQHSRGLVERAIK